MSRDLVISNGGQLGMFDRQDSMRVHSSDSCSVTQVLANYTALGVELPCNEGADLTENLLQTTHTTARRSNRQAALSLT
jgi:hypothetical protein